MIHYQLPEHPTEVIALQCQRLKLLGWNVPENHVSLQAELDDQIAIIHQFLATQNIPSLGKFALVSDDRIAEILTILPALFYGAWLEGRTTLAYTALAKMTSLSLQYGNSELSACGYVGFGLIAQNLLNSPVLAARFAAMAMELCQYLDLLSNQNLIDNTLTNDNPVPNSVFQVALMYLNLLDNIGDETGQTIYWQTLLTLNEQLKYWQDIGSASMTPHCLLLQAEIARLHDQKAAAIELYEQAIEEAQEQECYYIEALANELAARFYFDWQKTRPAVGYLQEAHACYLRWGEPSKAIDLEQNYAQILAQHSSSTLNSAIQQAEERYHQFAANIPVAIYQFERSATGMYQLNYVNDKFTELFGLSASYLSLEMSYQLFDNFALEDRSSLYQSLEDAAANQQPWSWEGRWIMPDGSIKWVRGESHLISTQDGAIIWNGIVLDITARKTVEERLQDTNQALLQATHLKDEFLTNVSHEIRTPLNAILGMSEILKQGVFGELNRGQLKSLLAIDQSGEHLLSLINDIIDVSRLSAGKLELNISSVNVWSLCHSSLAFFQQQAHDKKIHLDLKVCPGSGSVAVDERRMRQVLINLLSNALKFTPSGGQICLQVIRHQRTHHSNWIEFVVSDTGIGVDNVYLDKLFQPFVQVDSSLKRQYEGTGLGLTLAKQIVELHGGSIRLQSELGRGSCFTVRLPHICVILDIDKREFVPLDGRSDNQLGGQFLN